MPAVAPVAARAICARYELSYSARKLLREGMSPGDFIDALIKDGDCTSALEFLAYGLPPREAVWWGGLCLQHVFGEKLASNDRAAARAAILWVMQPTEPNRTAAAAPAQAAGALSAAGRLATAVAQFPPNTGQPNQPPIPPPYAANASIFDAMKLMWAKEKPERMSSRQKQFVDLGMQCGKGRIF